MLLWYQAFETASLRLVLRTSHRIRSPSCDPLVLAWSFCSAHDEWLVALSVRSSDFGVLVFVYGSSV